VRVVHVIDHMGMGGEQRLVCDLVEARAPDMEITVCALRRRDLPGVRERLTGAGVPYRALGIDRGNPLELVRFRSLLRHTRPDVLHLHLEYSTLLGAAAALSLGAPRPLLVASVANDPHRQALIHRWAGRLLAPWIDIHLTVSRGLADAVLRAYGPRPKRVESLAPGIDLSRFDGVPPNASTVAGYRRGARRVVGTIARLAAQKAIHVLLDATPLLLRDDPATRLLIVGDGPLRAALEHRARELGISHAVTFAGYQEDVVSAYGAMDVFVLPSRDEGYGLVFLEAMAMGVPVVGTRVIGTTDAVEDGVTGLLVPYNDAPALAQAVLRILGDPELACRLRGTAAERVRRGFSRERWTAQVEALYRDLRAARRYPASG
jgi:glycosyltransferase involved in cell wall biosynthesis